MALKSGSKIQISDINTALAGKLNTSGGTINGYLAVTGRIEATGAIKGMRLSANNGTNNNIDFMHDSKAEGGYYLNFDKISNGNWLEIATVGSGITCAYYSRSNTNAITHTSSGFANIEYKKASSGYGVVLTLPSGGTWIYFHGSVGENENTGIYRFFSGGTAISPTNGAVITQAYAIKIV